MVAMFKFDFYCTYWRTLRLVLFDKFNYDNTHLCPIIKSSNVSIKINNLDEFEDMRLIAAVFILRLLCNSKPYVSRFGIFRTFHMQTCDVLVQLNLSNVKTCDFLTLLVERIFPFLSSADYSFSILKNGQIILFNIVVLDMSSIRVVETHSVFFRWSDRIGINLKISCSSVLGAKFLLNGFKLLRGI